MAEWKTERSSNYKLCLSHQINKPELTSRALVPLTEKSIRNNKKKWTLHVHVRFYTVRPGVDNTTFLEQ